MAMTEQQFIELEGNINKVFTSYNESKKDYIPMMFNVINGTTSQFTDFTVGAPSRMTKWTGQVAYDNIKKGYQKQYRAEKYSTGIQVDRDLWEDGEYVRIKNLVTNIAQGVNTHMQYESASLFNDAFAGALYTGGDGLALCSASHKTTPGEVGTQSNLGTLDLDYTGLETTKRLMRRFVNDKGDRMLIEPDMIICGDYWEDTCKKLFGSEKEAFVADNNMNAYKDHKYFIHPLIDGKAWFYVYKDAMMGGSGANIFMRKDPRKTIERDGATASGDFNTEILSWKSIARYDIGFTNWWFAFGNNPA
jgi:phage major head subunit gpT-like protein